MKTTISKTFHVEEPIDKVWSNLSDPQEVVTCVPGAALTEIIDERNFKGTVTMKFGPIKAQYDGEIQIAEQDDDNYNLVMKGKGLDSKGKGSADMTMKGGLTEKDGGTDVEFTMDVSVVGMLAQFGSRLIKDVSDQVLKQFIDNFKAKLSGQEVENEMKAGSLMGSVVKNKIGGIFGGKKSE
jgi:carbon monoxide dehydrogenase subunit G